MIFLAREEGQFGVRVGGLTGVRCHEMGVYLLVELPLDVPFHGDFPGWEGDANLFYRWFDLDEPRMRYMSDPDGQQLMPSERWMCNCLPCKQSASILGTRTLRFSGVFPCETFG